jgi:hypothetical protein
MVPLLLAVVSAGLAPIVHIVIGLVIIGVCLYLVEQIPMDATIKTIIRVVVILFVVLWLLQTFGLL